MTYDDVFRRHHLDVYRFLLSRVRNQALAEDLSQQVWLVALTPYHRRPPPNVRSWLIRIAYNIMVDHWRRSQRLARILATLKEPITSVEAQVETRADLRLVMQAIRRLSVRDRRIIQLHSRGDSYAHIGKATGISEDGARKACQRIRAILRAAVDA